MPCSCFIWKSKKDIEDETTLTRDQQDRIRKQLVQKGWLEVKKLRANGAPTLHFKPTKAIQFTISGKPTNGLVGNPLMDKCLSHQSLTESTTESTTENPPKGGCETVVSPPTIENKIPKKQPDERITKLDDWLRKLFKLEQWAESRLLTRRFLYLIIQKWKSEEIADAAKWMNENWNTTPTKTKTSYYGMIEWRQRSKESKNNITIIR